MRFELSADDITAHARATATHGRDHDALPYSSTCRPARPSASRRTWGFKCVFAARDNLIRLLLQELTHGLEQRRTGRGGIT